MAKTANQVVVALTIQAVAEALTLARRSGVDPARVRQALLGGFARSKVLEVHGERMLRGPLRARLPRRASRQGLANALQAAREEGVPLLATAQVAEVLNELIANGSGARDHSALATLYEQLSAADEPAPV